MYFGVRHRSIDADIVIDERTIPQEPSGGEETHGGNSQMAHCAVRRDDVLIERRRLLSPFRWNIIRRAGSSRHYLLTSVHPVDVLTHWGSWIRQEDSKINSPNLLKSSRIADRRTAGREPVYLDETWVNRQECRTSTRCDTGP
jgi:hypothetical protein